MEMKPHESAGPPEPEAGLPAGRRHLSRRYFRDLCDRVLDFLDHEPIDCERAIALDAISRIEPGTLIYLSPKVDTRLFFSRIFPRIESPVFLMTGGTGHPNPNVHGRHLEARTQDGQPKILAWFCENKDRDDPRIVPIPIGVRQIFEAVIPELQEQAARLPRKTRLVCANFDPATAEERRRLCEHLARPEMGFVDSLAYTPHGTYAVHQAVLPYKFAFSPPGKGCDTYRCYEYLYLGVVPILKRDHISSLFDDLPVLVVDDWDEIDEPFLEARYVELGARFGFDDPRSLIECIREAPMLYMQAHIDRINSVIREAKCERAPVQLHTDWLDSEARRHYKLVFDEWYHYDPARDPEAPPEVARWRSAWRYAFKHLLYESNAVWIDAPLPGWLLDRLYEVVYVKPLANGSAFSPRAYRTLKLLSRIVLRPHDSIGAAVASLASFGRAVGRLDNTEFAPDWIIERPSGDVSA